MVFQGVDSIESLTYQGTKTTAEIDANYLSLANSLVYDGDQMVLYYIPANPTADNYKVEVPYTHFLYAERYVAGDNIIITDNANGTKSISAKLDGFTGYSIYSTMPSPADLTAADNANKVFFII